MKQRTKRATLRRYCDYKNAHKKTARNNTNENQMEEEPCCEPDSMPRLTTGQRRVDNSGLKEGAERCRYTVVMATTIRALGSFVGWTGRCCLYPLGCSWLSPLFGWKLFPLPVTVVLATTPTIGKH